MKKFLILIMIVSILLVGCGKQDKENNNDDSIETPKTSVTTTTSSTTNSTTTTKSTTTTSKTKKKTTKKITTKKNNTTTTKNSTTTTAKKLGKNEYISTVDGKAHKYSFIYSDKATCEEKSRKDAPYDTVFPVKPYVATRCEETKDLSGKSYWGIVYFEQADDSYKFYY